MSRPKLRRETGLWSRFKRKKSRSRIRKLGGRGVRKLLLMRGGWWKKRSSWKRRLTGSKGKNRFKSESQVTLITKPTNIESRSNWIKGSTSRFSLFKRDKTSINKMVQFLKRQRRRSSTRILITRRLGSTQFKPRLTKALRALNLCQLILEMCHKTKLSSKKCYNSMLWCKTKTVSTAS